MFNGKAFPLLYLLDKTFELLALILRSENRQFEVHENKQKRVHVRLGREPLYTYMCTRLLGGTSERNKQSGSAFLFYNLSKMIHIGQLIEAELTRQEHTISWFAKKLCCDRTNVYSIFKRQSIDTELLLRISTTLHYDFFALYSQTLRNDCEK